MPADPEDGFCSVAEAAERLGCTAQTVRNRLNTGQLAGRRVRRGRRADVRLVEISSIDAYLREHPPPRRASRGRQLNDLEQRVRHLEEQQRPNDAPDAVSLQYANLRLLAINEEYERVLHELLTADEHRRNALIGLQRVSADLRDTLQQFHLPASPPTDR